jgi:uncharacterized protein YhaN
MLGNMGYYRRPLPEKNSEFDWEKIARSSGDWKWKEFPLPTHATPDHESLLKALAEMAHDRDRWRKEAGRLDDEAESWRRKVLTLEVDCESWRRKAADSDSECVRLHKLWHEAEEHVTQLVAENEGHLNTAKRLGQDLALMTAEKNEWAKMAQDTARERDRWEQIAGEFAEKVARMVDIAEED